MVDVAKEVFPSDTEVDMALDLAGIPRVVRVRLRQLTLVRPSTSSG